MLGRGLVMNLWVPYKAGNFLFSLTMTSIDRRAHNSTISGSGAHPTSNPMGTGVKATGA